ncbi:hypothetical protein [Saccharothrix sp. ST-888]|uniref:hypothetical protein n=1 Tax=Saccharothrix sp. ST-888 TaxID=1427391 RepID=UPI000695E6A4|nr:hypothetical protein [Saccharothrix sp. ST-888]
MALVSPTRITDPTAQEPLLTYDLATSPDPLKASPENPATPEETGELIITASRNSGTPADVELIKVKVPAGTMSPDLATNLSSINPRITLNGWTTQRQESYDEIIFTPTASHETIGPDNGFTIQLSQIPINRKVGTAQIEVTEHSREGENGTFKDRTTVFNVGKFPADFYMKEFKVEGDLVIDNGGEATLTWQRSTNATYELLYGNTNLNVTNETTRTITNIKSDTTFYLRGTTSNDPTNPVTRILTAHITVRRPDLEVGNLTVHGAVTGNLTLTRGALTLQEGSLHVNGAVTARGNVTVTEGTLTASGPTNLAGPTQQLQSSELTNGAYVWEFRAETSGLVLVVVHVQDFDSYGGVGIYAEGEDDVVWRRWQYDQNNHTVVGVVRSGVTFRIGCSKSGTGRVMRHAYFIPFGDHGITSPGTVGEDRAVKEISATTLPQGDLPLTLEELRTRDGHA